MNNKILCFGELLLRMSPALQGEWIKQASMPVYIGGAELNVASALARWNLPVKYFSAAPDNYLFHEIGRELGNRNIDISDMHVSGKRIGIYFLPQGADLKHAGVIYDRAHSSFAELKPGMINWGKVLDGVSWFHFSAISPGLNENIAEVCKEGLEAAEQRNITISIDLNYRSLLWKYTRHPQEIMHGLVKHCDVVMGNVWSANSLLGIPVDENIHAKKNKNDCLAQAEKTSKDILQQFHKCKTVANTFRFNEGDEDINYYASLFNEGKQYNSYEFTVREIVDKVGSGDCFMAGLIYGLHHHHQPKDIINFAAAAAVGKFFEKGDATMQNIESIQSRINSHG
ncbi:MAG: sugar kinase [Bacteroidetes bacterium]|nr:sugar kinase [Bacteroidota bacterium]